MTDEIICRVTVTHVAAAGGVAFGKTPDQTGVFIPQSLVSRVNLEKGDVRDMKLLPNDTYRALKNIPPLRATFVSPLACHPVELETDILDFLHDVEVASSRLISEKLHVGEPEITAALASMFAKRQVVRATIETGPSDCASAEVVWATGMWAFEPATPDHDTGDTHNG